MTSTDAQTFRREVDGGEQTGSQAKSVSGRARTTSKEVGRWKRKVDSKKGLQSGIWWAGMVERRTKWKRTASKTEQGEEDHVRN